MRLTFLQIVNEILMRANIDTVTGLANPIPNTRRVMNAVNAASENLSRLHDWNFLRTSTTKISVHQSRNLILADSAISYDPLRKPIKISRTAGGYRELTEANTEEWERETGKTTPSKGNPIRYRRFGITTTTVSGATVQAQLIQLDPRPDSSIACVVEHRQLPARMTSDSDTTIWPDQALILEALKIYHDMKGRQAQEVEKERDRCLLPILRIDGESPRLRTGMLTGQYAPNLPRVPTSWTDF